MFWVLFWIRFVLFRQSLFIDKVYPSLENDNGNFMRENTYSNVMNRKNRLLFWQQCYEFIRNSKSDGNGSRNDKMVRIGCISYLFSKFLMWPYDPDSQSFFEPNSTDVNSLKNNERDETFSHFVINSGMYL